MLGNIGFRSAVRSLNVYLQKEAVPLRSHFDNIPARLGEWELRAEAPKLSAEMVEELGTELYLDRQYQLTGERDPVWISVHIAYYTGMIDAVPHVPDRCFVAGGLNARSRPRNIPMELSRRGWRVGDRATDGEPAYTVTFLDAITGAPVSVRMPQGEPKLRVTEFSTNEDPDARIYAGYFFVANGRIAVTPEQVKWIAFQKSQKRAYYCKVQFTAVGGKEFTAEAFTSRSARLTEALLPELMRALPDWTALETLSAAEAGSDDFDS